MKGNTVKQNIIIVLCVVSIALQFIALKPVDVPVDVPVDGAVWRVILNQEIQEDDSITVLQSHVLLEIGNDSLTFEELQ